MIRLDRFDNSDFNHGASRFTRGLWIVVRWIFFAQELPMPSALRAIILRLFGASIGRGVVIRSGVTISHPWNLDVGDFSWLGEGVRILSLGAVRVGPHCCISQETFLCTGSHDFRKRSFDLIVRPIDIGDGSWLCARCFVGPGVCVGENVQVLPGTVVLRDLTGGCVVEGSPSQPRPARSENR